MRVLVRVRSGVSGNVALPSGPTVEPLSESDPLLERFNIEGVGKQAKVDERVFCRVVGTNFDTAACGKSAAFRIEMTQR